MVGQYFYSWSWNSQQEISVISSDVNLTNRILPYNEIGEKGKKQSLRCVKTSYRPEFVISRLRETLTQHLSTL